MYSLPWAFGYLYVLSCSHVREYQYFEVTYTMKMEVKISSEILEHATSHNPEE
jgi:hypothetical protein